MNFTAPEMSSGRKKQAIAKDKDLFENAPPAKKLKKLNTAGIILLFVFKLYNKFIQQYLL